MQVLINSISTHSIAVAGAAALLVSSVALGQSREVPAPPQQQPVLVHGATIHTITGETIERGYVLFEDGVITAIGEGDGPGIRAQRHNADGLHVYPGLISSSTILGLTEVGAVDVTQDNRETGDFKPEVRAAVAVNPDSDLIPVARANGILTAMTFPSGGTIAGRCSLLRLDGWTWEDMAIDAEAGLVVNWPRTGPSPFRRRGRGGGDNDSGRDPLAELNQFFDDAQAYIRAKDADETVHTDLRFEAMRPYLAGEKQIYINASSLGQIESAVAWSLKRNVRIVIVGGHEADQALALLTKHDIPVIVEGTHRMPRARHDDYDRAFALPMRLYEAGVRFCIASGAEAPHERNLNHTAASAAAYGLPRDEAVRAVTQSAAEILGVGDQLGSLQLGKQATLIITTGDPLEITTDVLAAFIDGRRIDLGSRHKALYAKYLEKYRQLDRID